jgi:hypothetical protein
MKSTLGWILAIVLGFCDFGNVNAYSDSRLSSYHLGLFFRLPLPNENDLLMPNST